MPFLAQGIFVVDIPLIYPLDFEILTKNTRRKLENDNFFSKLKPKKKIQTETQNHFIYARHYKLVMV